MKWFKRLFPVTLCAALLISVASAAAPSLIASNPNTDTDASETTGGQENTAQPISVRVWGTLTKLEDGGLQLKNSGEMDGVINEIILHGENIIFLDAVSGAPITLDDLSDGEMVYAYVSPVMTRSEPPQATAYVVIGNIPADFGIPAYYEITDRTMISTLMTENNLISATLSTDQGVDLTFNLTDQLDEEGNRQYILKNEVTIQSYPDNTEVSVNDLTPGTRILVWTDTSGNLSKVLVFPSIYSGYLKSSEDGTVLVNDQALESKAISNSEGQFFLPIRAVCEALGYTVTWDNAAKAMTVSEGDTVLFSYVAGADAAQVNGQDLTLSAASLAQEGSTYLPAVDLARLLDLYLIP